MREETTVVSVRMPRKLHAEINKLADDQFRTLNGQILYLLRLGLDASKQSVEGKQTPGLAAPMTSY